MWKTVIVWTVRGTFSSNSNVKNLILTQDEQTIFNMFISKRFLLASCFTLAACHISPVFVPSLARDLRLSVSFPAEKHFSQEDMTSPLSSCGSTKASQERKNIRVFL